MTSDNRMNGGQVIIDYLIREKVPYVFGLCGHGNIGIIDAMYERSDDIKTISVHHESVSGFMADVYYRVSGQPTATFTSCGPGSANMPISLGNAFLDSVPFLAITGNVPTGQFGRGAFQELYRHYQADFPSTVQAYCKRVYQPTRGEQVPLMVRQAWKTMVTGRPGPVVLDVPFDIFKEASAEETPNPEEWTRNISSRCGADPDGVIEAVDMLLGAEKPVIVVGQGVRRRDVVRRRSQKGGRGEGVVGRGAGHHGAGRGEVVEGEAPAHGDPHRADRRGHQDRHGEGDEEAFCGAAGTGGSRTHASTLGPPEGRSGTGAPLAA